MAFTTFISSSPNHCCRTTLQPISHRSTTVLHCSSVSSPSSIRTTYFDLKTYRSTLRQEINQKLDEAIPIQYPQQIYEAMRYSVLAKDVKHAPPVMVVAACELFGGVRLAAFPTTCALEMVRLNVGYICGCTNDRFASVDCGMQEKQGNSNPNVKIIKSNLIV